MVEKDIDDDAGKAPSFRGEVGLALEKDRVSIGEAVDSPVEHDSFDEISGVSFEQAVLGASHKVRQKRADPGGVGGAGKVEVGEEVQGLRA